MVVAAAAVVAVALALAAAMAARGGGCAPPCARASSLGAPLPWPDRIQNRAAGLLLGFDAQ